MNVGSDVREAGLEDVPGIVDLVRDAFGESATWGMPSSALAEGAVFWREGILAERFRVLVRRDGRRTVGVLRYRKEPDGWWSFARVAVAPAQRRRGVARELLVELENKAVASGAPGLRCTSRSDDGDGHRLYPACGFVEAGRSNVRRGGSDIPVVLWEKRLGRAILP